MKKNFFLEEKHGKNEGHFTINGVKVPDSYEENESLSTIFNYHYEYQVDFHTRRITVDTIGSRSFIRAYYCSNEPGSPYKEGLLSLENLELLGLLDCFEKLLFPELKITSWKLTNNGGVFIDHEPKQK